jgi:predicted transcriptional regulator
VLPPRSRNFQLAHQIALLGFRSALDGCVGTGRLASPTSQVLGRVALANYFAGAVLMPYEAFLGAARSVRYDIELLGHRFRTSFEQVCHRLVTLRRPGAEAVPFGFMRVDAAGFVTKRFPLPRLPLPRHGNACPLWAAYEAFQAPGAIVRQLAAFPGGDRFLFLARTVEKPRPAYAMPRRLLSIMLACDALHADELVYGDGLDLRSSAPAVPVGPHCRLCVRRDCAYREEDPILDAGGGEPATLDSLEQTEVREGDATWQPGF